jgi:hypothetical protein
MLDAPPTSSPERLWSLLLARKPGSPPRSKLPMDSRPLRTSSGSEPLTVLQRDAPSYGDIKPQQMTERATREKPSDLRFATDKERRFALAYLRWLAGAGRRRFEPAPTHRTYELSPLRGDQIRSDIKQLALDAARGLRS